MARASERRTKTRAAPRRPRRTPGVGPYPPEFIGPRITRDLSPWTPPPPTPEEIAEWKTAAEERRKFDRMLAADAGWRRSAPQRPQSKRKPARRPSLRKTMAQNILRRLGGRQARLTTADATRQVEAAWGQECRANGVEAQNFPPPKRDAVGRFVQSL